MRTIDELDNEIDYLKNTIACLKGENAALKAELAQQTHNRQSAKSGIEKPVWPKGKIKTETNRFIGYTD